MFQKSRFFAILFVNGCFCKLNPILQQGVPLKHYNYKIKLKGSVHKLGKGELTRVEHRAI